MSKDLIQVETIKFVEAFLKKVKNECLHFYSQETGHLADSEKKLLMSILQRFYCCVQKRVYSSIEVVNQSSSVLDSEIGESLQELVSKKEEALSLNEMILQKRNQNSGVNVSCEEMGSFHEVEEGLSNELDLSKFERNEFQENLLGDLMAMISSLKSSLNVLDQDILEKEKTSISNLQVFVQQISTMGPQSSALESTLSELQGISNNTSPSIMNRAREDGNFDIPHTRARLAQKLDK